MEFLTRLRTVWTAVCVIATVIFFIGYAGNPQPHLLALVLAAAAAGVSFHVPGTWRMKLSVLWLGGVGIALVGSQLGRVGADKLVLQTTTFVAAVWIVAAVAVYLIGPLFSRSSKVSDTD